MTYEQRSKLTALADATPDGYAEFAEFAVSQRRMIAPPPDDFLAKRAECPAMPLPRAAWLVTVAVALITALIVFLNGYTGYGVVSLVIAASAAINVR
ncbi:hypothetical protein [Capillimicrobium parvum]|uniref:Uncharacterized protein n=1 Tax=Capillimicrobium parvum TaxID=2884022 RepID=A0A9E6Y116_9ACTN|nr:hypothetical protein [Capillimicrobium parvum]UGS37688.1 hypothetical protein DSM104329_04108 [Capillimicrobium parvum]